MMFKKTCVTAIVCLLANYANAGSKTLVNNYSELYGALARGDTVRAVMQFEKCSPSMKSIGAMNFTIFNTYTAQVDGKSKEVIATSVNVLYQDNRFGPTYNYVRMRVYDDNTAEIFSQYLDPKSFVPVANSETTQCKISNGHDQNGLQLYVL